MENLILIIFIAYTLLIFLVSRLTTVKSGNNTFFTGNRKSPWFVVAYGMIGASLSGVTFMSVPGGVYSGQFTYLPLVFGYVIGYIAITFVLLPLYYKLNLTSIYSYLGIKFGKSSEKIGALLFIISRLVGSAIRMYLVVFVLHEFVFKSWDIPFCVPAVIFITIILLYTFKGGIKTVVWTDTLQTTFLLLSAIMTVVIILKELDISFAEVMITSSERGLTKVFETDWTHSKFYVKQILSGAFITIAMTGLDQDMMQKNLSCKSLRDAQKNVLTSSFFFIIVNVLFMTLGATLVYYAQETGFQLAVNENGVVINDKIFPSIAFSLNSFTSILFIIGLIAAGYSSADGTLTALTTSFCFDFLDFGTKKIDEDKKLRYRKIIHISFALLYLLIIILFKPFHNESLIDIIFEVAGYTYGPLLGMFCFGLFIKNRKVMDKYVPIIAISSPVISYILNIYSEELFFGYKFGFEILIVNAMITIVALLCVSKKESIKYN